LAIVGFLIFSYALPQDLSRTTPIYSRLVQASFFGRVLTFHLALLLAGLAALAFVFRRWRLGLLAGLVSLLSFSPSLKPLLRDNPPSAAAARFRIMSMNLKYTHAQPELIVDQIRKFKPDVLVLQDYTPFAESALRAAFSTEYPHRFVQPNTLQGLAIYSRMPFAARPQATFTKTRRQMRAVVRIDGKPIVIYIEHPYSPRTGQRIMNNRLATLDLAMQAAAETSPVVVAGDFNFTGNTPNEDALKDAGLEDGFELAGHGRGSTWPVEPRWMRWLPGVRIDHIFVSRELTCTQFFVGDYDGSDHLPIVADVGMRPSR
jgi:endonuclease/exonuclease/phosphatase (EEP) superfamily protein YafD